MDIPIDYLRDEVRSGFYIPTAVKQAWSAQLMVLSEIDRICKKYDITYFAEWGTFLGTVRHGGYIPWDDDMDISMKRKDYIRFREVADKELPDGFAIHDYDRKDDHWLFLSRVVNTNRMCFDDDHLEKYNNFPYIAPVDIFVLDYLYADEEKEKERCEEIKYILAVADAIVEGNMPPNLKELELRKLENKYKVTIDRKLGAVDTGRRLYRIAEEQMARTREEESDRIGQIFPWVLKGSRGLPKRYYESTVRLPFEMIEMPVPAYYHKVLSNRYGNYFEVRKVWDGHDYPYFEGQKKNLQAVAEFTLPEFVYNAGLLRTPATELSKEGSFRNLVSECAKEMKAMLDAIYIEAEAGNYETVADLLTQCQQLAIDLGTLTESVKGENNASTTLVVGHLEKLCECLYAVYETFTDENGLDSSLLKDRLNNLKHISEGVLDVIRKEIITKRDILFITSGVRQWKGLESVCRDIVSDSMKETDKPISLNCNSDDSDNNAANNNAVDICVMPVPMLKKNIYGQVTMSNDEILDALDYEQYIEYFSRPECADYAENINLVAWNTYSLELHHPDVIYIQELYDSENPCMTIPPQFYAKNLQKYTGSLIYVQALKTAEFGLEDPLDMYNMKHYVTAPAVICADKVIVQSDNIRNNYIEKLTSFAGEETRDIWEAKLVVEAGEVATESIQGNSEAACGKNILFCIGCNEAYEIEEAAVEKLRKKMDVFEQYGDKVKVGICLYPGNINEWYANEQIKLGISSLIEEYAEKDWCDLCEFNSNADMMRLAEEYTAYYGSPGPFVHMFTCLKKPVMLADLNM